MVGIARLTGTVKHYDWGGDTFIPALIGVKTTDSKPFAEYWLGTHPQADCKIILNDGKTLSLREAIRATAADTLGEYVNHHFGDLPYLLKALDVKEMLSIQVHPTKAAAEKDFAEENERGLPLNAPERNYKDANHKPELMVAMGEFWLLHGFKPRKEMRRALQQTPELKWLLPIFEEGSYTDVYRRVMEMSQDEVNKTLQPLLDRIIPLYKEGKLQKTAEDFWAARAAISFPHPDHIDRGIFSIYLFNLVRLEKGEGIFQDAGVPHAYLEGQNVEIMASSDNVLRGGLTTKHVDVRELIKHVKCEPTVVNVIKGGNASNPVVYKTPAPDFELSAFHLQKDESASIIARTAEILLLVKGHVELATAEESVTLHLGEPSAIVFSGSTAMVTAKEPSLFFRASVPVDK